MIHCMDFFLSFVMEIQPSFVLILPLKQIALRRIAVGLWTERDILTSIGKIRVKKYADYSRGNCLETVECKVSGKISKLQLPESLAKQMMQVLKPIGLQMMRWKTFHEDHLDPVEWLIPCKTVLGKLQWTAAGTVDYRKTAEELVRCGVFDIVKRYKLACLYCLDNYIPEIWKELPEDGKMYFYYEEGLSHIGQSLLQFYWPRMLKGEEYKLDALTGRTRGDETTFHQYMFTRLSMDGNKSAADYFFQMLSPIEREISLNKMVIDTNSICTSPTSSFPKEKVTEIAIYLLSQMTPEQRIEIFRQRPADVLGCFLYWPWQEVFLDFADTMWTWVRCEDLERRASNYDTLLDNLKESFRDSDYRSPSLYRNFFLHSPDDFKKHFVDRECEQGPCISFFAGLFRAEDTETIGAILSSLDAGDRLRLASARHVLKRFDPFISSGEGHLVETCLRDAGLSREDKASMKEAFVRYLARYSSSYSRSIESPEFRGFFEFLDETEPRTQVKRIIDDGPLIGLKKFCFAKEDSSTIK